MWTPERTDLAAKLWREGMAARDIAERVGGGATKNAIIGKAHRQRWIARGASHHSRAGKTRRIYDNDAVLNRWLAGQTEKQIGIILGYPPRRISGIVCEARRKGDPRAVHHGPATWERRTHVWQARVYKPKAPRRPRIEDMAKPESFNLSLMELARGVCRWPEGDGPFTFCGRGNFGGRSYCEYHCRLAYQPLEQRSERDIKRQAQYYARAA